MMEKIRIPKRILLMFSAVVLLSSLSFGILFFWILPGVRQNTQEVGQRFKAEVMAFAEESIAFQVRKQLREAVEEKVRVVERELDVLRENTAYLANAMTRILQHPEHYSPRQLPNPVEKHVAPGEAYLLVTSRVREECGDAGVMREIALASNVVDEQEVLAGFYASYLADCYFGSRHGYSISLEYYDSEEMYRKIHTRFYHEDYDPREHLWYQLAAVAEEPVITDAYVGADGNPKISCAAPYYDAEGFAGAAGLGVQLKTMYQLISDRPLGNSTINFVMDGKGEILFSSEKDGSLAVGDGQRDLRKALEESLAQEAENMTGGKSGFALVTLEGEDYYLAYAPVSSVGWSFGTLLKRSEVLASAVAVREALSAQEEHFDGAMDFLFVRTLGILALVFLLLFWLFFRGSHRLAERFGRPIFVLAEGVREIAGGNLDKKIDIRTGDELAELSGSVNHMTAELKEYMANLFRVTAEKQRTATEFSTAQEIRRDMIPHSFPAYPERKEIDLYASLGMAKDVGGDFYDFYLLDENHLVVTIANVSGTGIGAALFMAISKAILKNIVLAPGSDHLAERVSRANNQILQDNTADMFVKTFLGVLDMRTGAFSYVNAGNHPPLVYRAKERKFEYLAVERDLVLGVRKGIRYAGQEIVFSPGDSLFLYTDGVIEAVNEKDELYGRKRLLDTLNRLGEGKPSSRELVDGVRASLAAHEGNAELTGAFTMLGIRFLGVT